MVQDESQLSLEDLMHRVHEDSRTLAKAREREAHERALARVLLRDDVMSCHIRDDGTLESVDLSGHTTIRPAGWRGR